MKPERYARVGEIFAVVCDLDEPEQARRLQELCGDDAELRRDVQTMLRHDMAEQGLVAPAAGEPPQAGDRAGDAGDAWPETIGPFRILGRIAEGGMGTVFEAEQTTPRRRVALKIIRSGFASPSLLRRFEQEAHVLGLLEHPGIARIYEAGTAETGFGRQPYFAMERVRGRSIIDYANTHELSTRARLELMARVCQAIHHAHQKGVIHRDLKPGNILVEESAEPGRSMGTDGETIGQPKVVDFGVARVTDLDLRTTTLQTDVGQLVGTLPYMSPEQASGDPAGIDIRSDVFSLGVVTFELLADRLPYSSDLRGGSLPEAVQAIRDGVTTRLGSIDARLRGDIDTIVAKALAPDKDSRYDSAAAMAADIRRHLADEPIVARPSTAWYQLRKFARRNRPLLSGLAAALLLLLVALGATAYGLLRARQGEQDALMVAEFLTRTLESAQPEAGGRDVLLLEALLDAVALLDDPESPFALNPRVEARLRLTVGTTFRSLGALDMAPRHLDRAVELFRRSGGPAPELARAIDERAHLHAVNDELDEASALWEEILSLPLPKQELLRARHHLGAVTREGGDPGAAERLLSRVLAERQALLGPTHADTLFTRSALGKTYAALGQDEKAERIFRDVLEIRRRALGEDDLLTLSAASTLGGFLAKRRRLDEAEPLLRNALERQSKLLGEHHPDVLTTRSMLAGVLLNKGPRHREQAIEILEAQCRILEETRGPEASETLSEKNRLAVALRKDGQRDRARGLYESILRTRRAGPDPDGEAADTTMHNLGLVYRLLERLDDAEALLMESYALREARLPEGDEELRNTMDQIARVWLARGTSGALTTEEASREALRWTTRVVADEGESPHRSRDNGMRWCAHGRALKGVGRFAEAADALYRSFEFFRMERGEANSRTREALQECVDLYGAWGQEVPEHVRAHMAASEG